jgi:hypothetical protein
MKRLILTILLLISNLFAEVNLHDSKIVDEIGIAGIYPNMKLLDKDAASIWFLRENYPAKWEKVKNDEFELHDAMDNAFNVLKSLIKEKYNDFINQKGVVNVLIGFDKYNFHDKYFPLETMTKDSYLTFGGDKFISSLYLYFDNTGDKEKKLYMQPKTAKTFLENKKDSWGNINRNVIAKYYFIIKKINTDVNSINQNSVDNYEDIIHTKVIGHIYKIEIIDPKTNKVLVTFNKK